MHKCEIWYIFLRSLQSKGLRREKKQSHKTTVYRLEYVQQQKNRLIDTVVICFVLQMFRFDLSFQKQFHFIKIVINWSVWQDAYVNENRIWHI